MNKKIRLIHLCTLSATISLTLLVAQQKRSDPKATEIVKNFEEKLNLEGGDVTSLFTLIQRKEGQADSVLKVKVFRRDSASKFTLLFDYPPSEKGKGYLRSGDDLYLYLPTTREFVYRNRKDDVGSTDVRTDLFGKLDLLNAYIAKYIGTEIVSKMECDVIELEGKTLDVSFPIQKWFIRKSDRLPIKVENYSASRSLLRTFYYIEYKEVRKNKFLFTKLRAINNLEKNQSTFLINEEVSGTKIADYTFSQPFLEEQSR